ncbi:hypothetical protein BJY52DRAFT_1193266 [Lactarius psammicola]|nr:hypothetical protein BJY52DRAFT_1193266 [Lactarius psammicola]
MSLGDHSRLTNRRKVACMVVLAAAEAARSYACRFDKVAHHTSRLSGQQWIAELSDIDFAEAFELFVANQEFAKAFMGLKSDNLRMSTIYPPLLIAPGSVVVFMLLSGLIESECAYAPDVHSYGLLVYVAGSEHSVLLYDIHYLTKRTTVGSSGLSLPMDDPHMISSKASETTDDGL